MLTLRMKAIVRQFRENGIKLLLEDPSNVRDLLNITRTHVLNLIDFDRLTLVRTTFVQRDYRHVEAVVVLRGPLRGPSGRRSHKGILIYILIEHQSEPDVLMLLRLLDYQVQIYKTQMREWNRHHTSLAGFRLQPVLPVVFYTGTRTWESIGQLTGLMELGDRFVKETPHLEPLFINLGTIPAGELEATGGFFGWVLRLIQERRARRAEFQALLERAVQHLETMPAVERGRWLSNSARSKVIRRQLPIRHRFGAVGPAGSPCAFAPGASGAVRAEWRRRRRNGSGGPRRPRAPRAAPPRRAQPPRAAPPGSPRRARLPSTGSPHKPETAPTEHQVDRLAERLWIGVVIRPLPGYNTSVALRS